jgi:hypothetical protein
MYIYTIQPSIVDFETKKIIDSPPNARENKGWIGAVSRCVRNADVHRSRPKPVFGDLLRVKSLFLKTLQDLSQLTV